MNKEYIDMKAKYVYPVTEVMVVQGYGLMTSVSGGNTGLVDGGQAGDNIDPQ